MKRAAKIRTTIEAGTSSGNHFETVARTLTMALTGRSSPIPTWVNFTCGSTPLVRSLLLVEWQMPPSKLTFPRRDRPIGSGHLFMSPVREQLAENRRALPRPAYAG